MFSVLVGGVIPPSFGACVYSLYETRVDKVIATSQKELPSEPQYTDALPEDLQDPSLLLFSDVCECKYVPSRSSFTCSEMSIFQTRIFPAPDLPTARARAKSMCDCPGLLTQ